MQLAYVDLDSDGVAKSALLSLANDLLAHDIRCVGLVDGTLAPGTKCHRCDQPVLILPDRKPCKISQALGAHSYGCRLDPGALEWCVAETTRRLQHGADLMVLNKFGKEEAEGRGFRALIADALVMGIPVIAGISARNRQPFKDFASGLAIKLPPKREALMHWAMALVSPQEQST